MSAAVTPRSVWRLADDLPASAELLAEAVALIDRARTAVARLAGAEVALDAGDVRLGRSLLRQALDDLDGDGRAS